LVPSFRFLTSSTARTTSASGGSRPTSIPCTTIPSLQVRVTRDHRCYGF
jgi:hypothetical protein